MKVLQVVPMLLVSTVTFAQQFPDAPKPKFFDRETAIELTLSGSALAADAYLTNGRGAGLAETNPVLGRFPSTTTSVGYFSAVFAGELGGMYFFRGHKWIKRGIPLAITAIEVGYAARNLSVKRSAPGCFNQVGSVLTPAPCVAGR